MVIDELQDGDSVSISGETYVFHRTEDRAFWTQKGQEVSADKAKHIALVLPALQSEDIKRAKIKKAKPTRTKTIKGSELIKTPTSLPRIPKEDTNNEDLVGDVYKSLQDYGQTKEPVEVKFSKQALEDLAKILTAAMVKANKQEDRRDSQKELAANPLVENFKKRMRQNIPILRMFTNLFENKDDIAKGVTPKQSITRLFGFGRTVATPVTPVATPVAGPAPTPVTPADITKNISTQSTTNIINDAVKDSSETVNMVHSVYNSMNKDADAVQRKPIEVKFSKEALEELAKILTAAMVKSEKEENKKEDKKKELDKNPLTQNFKKRMRQNVPILRPFTDMFEESEDVEKGITPKQSIMRLFGKGKKESTSEGVTEESLKKNTETETAELTKQVTESMQGPSAIAASSKEKIESDTESDKKQERNGLGDLIKPIIEGLAEGAGLAGLGKTFGKGKGFVSRLLGRGGAAKGVAEVVEHEGGRFVKDSKGLWRHAPGEVSTEGKALGGRFAPKTVSSALNKAGTAGTVAEKVGGSRLGRVLGTGGKVLGRTAVGLQGLLSGYSEYKKTGSATRGVGVGAGTVAGSLAGAEAGGLAGAQIGGGIGALFGGVGAVPGAAIGGVLGAIGGGALGAWGGERLTQTGLDVAGVGVKKPSPAPAVRMPQTSIQPQARQVKTSSDQLRQKQEEINKNPMPVIINNSSNQNINNSSGGNMPYIATASPRGSLATNYFAF